MKARQKRCLLSGIVLMLFLCGCGKSEMPEKAETGIEAENAALQNGEAAEDAEELSEELSEEETEGISFEGQDMKGNTITSSVLTQSRLTMVNVWATYCNPCLREMPDLGELAGEYDPGDFQIIGIISDVQEGAAEKSLEYAEGLIEQTGADYPHLLLNESIYRALLTEVSAVPTSFFLDENGQVLDVVVGAMDKAAWEEKINGLLEK